MSNIINKIKNKPIIEYAIAIAFFVIASIIFANATGILSSGYHLVDDHEIIDINAHLAKEGFFKTLLFFVSDDLTWRFRPLFFIVRVIRSFIFRTNFFLWHLSVAIECGLYCGFSYVLARKLKAPIIPSLAFSFIWLIGTQDEIIWRMGTQENMGMVFLSLSFLLAYLYFENNNKKYEIATIISTILMMMCKESFLLLGPSVILFLFYLYVVNNKENINIFNAIWEFIKKYKTIIISICVFLIIGLLTIFFYVGLMDQGYAGIDTSISLIQYMRLTYYVFIRDLKEYWICLILIGLIVVYSIIKKLIKKEFNKKEFNILFAFLFLIDYSIVIEAVLHAKSSIFDRYKLPCIWFIYLALFIMQHDKINKYLHHLLVICLCILTFFAYNQKDADVYYDGLWFGGDGKQTTEMFDYIGLLKEKSNDLTVLTNFMWYEHNMSSSMYLQVQEKVNNVYYYDDSKTDGNYIKLYNYDGSKISIADADVIITDNNLIDTYNLDNYEVNRYSWYYVLTRK